MLQWCSKGFRNKVIYKIAAMASSFLDMRLSIACAATDADYQNRIILQDNILNLHVVARKPHPDSNYTPHAAALRVTAA